MSFHPQTIELWKGDAFEGPLDALTLAGAEKVAMEACTIGSALEERMTRVFADEPVRGLAPGAGTAALVKLLRRVSGELSDTAKDHEKCPGLRAQPRPEGWAIWQQAVTFRRLAAG